MINFVKKLERHWPLPAAVCLLWCVCGYLFITSIQLTNGHFTYTLDDAYIHLAMAKNFAQHGIYGVTPYEFSSSSSSIVWTLVLAAGVFVFGAQETLPLLLNIVLASIVLGITYRILVCNISQRIALFFILAAIIFLTPLPAMIFSGMEHVLHILLVFLFVYYGIYVLEIHNLPSKKKWSDVGVFFLLTMLLVITRFESYAIVFAVAGIMTFRKNWKLAIGVCMSAAIPLLIYQYISISHGWSWLPNSILIRSNAPEVFNSQQAVEIHAGSLFSKTGFFANFFQNIQIGSHVYVLSILGLITGCVLAVRMRTIWSKSLIFLILFLASAFAHLLFGKIGHFFRYEAYLMAWGILACALIGNDLIKSYHLDAGSIKKRGFIVLLGTFGVVGFCMPIFNRSMIAWKQIPIASGNIYEQQYQMGLFLQRYYPSSAVAVNDIGAIAFLTDDKILDLVGLASADVLELKMQRRFSNETINRLSQNRNVQIAIVYDFWLELSGLNADSLGWKKAGDWFIQNNVVCGGNCVSFYSVKRDEDVRLRQHLKEFSKVLPPTVHQQGRYLSPVLE